MVEGEHFHRKNATPQQLGHKALAINISDIAAMGGYPKYALISIAIHEETPTEYLESIYDGLREEGEKHQTTIVGGNISRSANAMVLDVHLLGESDPSLTLLRSGAQPGDVLMVTGTLGDATAGFRLLYDSESKKLEKTGVLSSNIKPLVDAFLLPTPRVLEGQSIARSKMATAMIDLSDGISGDVSHLCQASKTGVLLHCEQFPISDALRNVAKSWNRDPITLALQGGEDYELLLTARADESENLATRVFQETGTVLTPIGSITTPDKGIKILRQGREEPITVGSYDHLRGETSSSG
jgi:thiamine-monophosphate kinase